MIAQTPVAWADRMAAQRVSPIATLSPGVFAMVMATGIIAVASSQQGIEWLADARYVVTAVMYVALILALLARIIRYPAALTADLTSHSTGFAFRWTLRRLARRTWIPRRGSPPAQWRSPSSPARSG